jgi:phage terminase Nu1 subunit (DNA packaging protein)
MFVNAKTMAKIMDLSERRINQLVSDGVIVKESDGQYNVMQVIIDYYKNKSGVEAGINYDQEHALHEKAKREKAEMINAKLKGQLHDAKDVEQVMTNMLVTFRSKMLGLPYKLAPKLVRQKSVNIISSVLDKEIKDALLELSEYDPALFTSEIEGVEDEEENN